MTRIAQIAGVGKDAALPESIAYPAGKVLGIEDLQELHRKRRRAAHLTQLKMGVLRAQMIGPRAPQKDGKFLTKGLIKK